MSEWEDIIITGRDKESSTNQVISTPDGPALGKQVFRLNQPTPKDWREIFDGIFIAEPGRLGREARATSTSIHLWGGPFIFDERDANHLKELVAYTNKRFRESLEPEGDLSGFDAFGA